MLTFFTLFLGLTVGVQPVELKVGGEVAAVELLLDGRSAGTLSEAPWTLACNFGTALVPHELVAVGHDRQGHEVARVRQWINLPRPRTEVQLLLEEAELGAPRFARLTWESVEGSRPTALVATFDGVPLAVRSDGGIQLPPYDTAQAHLLSAEVEMGNRVGRTEMVVGGRYFDTATSGLTAVPVVVRRDAPLPSVESLEGYFLIDGEPLRIAAVEQGPADLVVVRPASLSFQSPLLRLGKELDYRQAMRGNANPFGLVGRDRVRVLFPELAPTVNATLPVEQFPLTLDLAPVLGAGLLTATTHPFEREGGAFEPIEWRLADAVAVAGLAAAEGGRTRAVVVALDRPPGDDGSFDWQTVEGYLESLRVPLVVWSPLGQKRTPAELEAEDIGSARKLVAAVGRLRSLLDRQVVVWLEGNHLPQRIELAREAQATLRLAGEPLPEGFLPEAEPPEPYKIQTAEHRRGAGEASEPPSSDDPTFGDVVEVNVVNVEVQVSDHQGRRVAGLGPDDFELYEDGEKVDISQFYATEEPIAAEGAPVIGESAKAEEEPVSVAEERKVHVVLFLDRTHLQPATRHRLVQELGEFLSHYGSEEQAPPARVLLVAHGGAVRLEGKLDRLGPELAAALEEAAKGYSVDVAQASDRRYLVNEIARTAQELREGERAALRFGEEGTFGLSAATARRDRTVTLLRAYVQEAQHQAQSTVATLEGMVRALAGLPGRKALLYVGEGLTMSPGADLLLLAEHLLRLPEFEQARLASDIQNLALQNRREYQGLGRLANAHGVTFYTLSAAEASGSLLFGTEVNLSGEESGVGAALAGGASLRSSFREQVTSDVREASCFLSGTTGGLCQVDGDSEDLMAAAVADFTTVYSLGFVPAHRGDGEYHDLTVKVKRPDLSVRHRSGYLDKPMDERLRDRLVTALVFGAEDNRHDLTVKAEGTMPAGSKLHRVPLRVTVPLDRLVLLPQPGKGKLLLQGRILLLTQAPNGELGKIREIPIRREIAESELPPGSSVSYANTVQLSLPEGAWKVAVGLWDEIGQAGSFIPGVVRVGEMQEMAEKP